MKNYSKKERQKHVENWEKGTLTRAAYAKSAGIQRATFYKWAQKVNTEPHQDFVEIKKKRFVADISNEIIIQKSGIVIRVPCSMELTQLQIIFTALENMS